MPSPMLQSAIFRETESSIHFMMMIQTMKITTNTTTVNMIQSSMGMLASMLVIVMNIITKITIELINILAQEFSECGI